MSKRSITIEATGCHDCSLIITERCGLKYCFLTGGYVDSRSAKYYKEKTFHPDCPMKPIEESE